MHLNGIVYNLWGFGSIIISMEYIRYMIINNVLEKDKKKIAIYISIVYIFIDFNISRYNLTGIRLSQFIKDFMQILLPAIAENILFSYFAMFADYRASIIYKLGINAYNWLTPIIPKLSWAMIAIIDTVFPLIIFVYMQYQKVKNSVYKTKSDVERAKPRGTITVVVILVIASWFALGLFPVKPIAIASASMINELHIGDVAIIKKCKPDDIKVGDIIQYQMDGFTVVHRVIEMKMVDGEFVFTTKGDNNKQQDSEPVKQDQLLGKCILKVKYLGYPAIWLHVIQTEDARGDGDSINQNLTN